jgi:hypothetical protein
MTLFGIPTFTQKTIPVRNSTDHLASCNHHHIENPRSINDHQRSGGAQPAHRLTDGLKPWTEIGKRMSKSELDLTHTT